MTIQGGLRAGTAAKTFASLYNSQKLTARGETELNGLAGALTSEWLATGGTWGSRGSCWWLGWVEEGSEWEKNG